MRAAASGLTSPHRSQPRCQHDPVHEGAAQRHDVSRVLYLGCVVRHPEHLAGKLPPLQRRADRSRRGRDRCRRHGRALLRRPHRRQTLRHSEGLSGLARAWRGVALPCFPTDKFCLPLRLRPALLLRLHADPRAHQLPRLSPDESSSAPFVSSEPPAGSSPDYWSARSPGRSRITPSSLRQRPPS
jgi:hypothetical protein